VRTYEKYFRFTFEKYIKNHIKYTVLYKFKTGFGLVLDEKKQFFQKSSFFAIFVFIAQITKCGVLLKHSAKFNAF